MKAGNSDVIQALTGLHNHKLYKKKNNVGNNVKYFSLFSYEITMHL